MELKGGERIFSRVNSRALIHYAKKARKSKKDRDYMILGKKMFKYIDTQNRQTQEYVSLEK
jgi:hypothetical protein